MEAWGLPVPLLMFCCVVAVVQYSASVPQFVPSYQPAAAAGYVNTQQPAGVMATQQHVSPVHRFKDVELMCAFVLFRLPRALSIRFSQVSMTFVQEPVGCGV